MKNEERYKMRYVFSSISRYVRDGG